MLAYPIAIVLALQTLAAIPQAGPEYVKCCDPRSIVLRDGSPPVDFRFEVETAPLKRVVKSIVFERGGHTVQKLDVPSMTPLARDGSFFFGGQDINFDTWLGPSTGCMTLRPIAFATLASFRCFAWMPSTSN
jgi:hypothetical protein